MHYKLKKIFQRYLLQYSGLPTPCWKNIFLIFIESLASGICFFLSLYFVNYLKSSIIDAGLFISFYGIGTILGGFLGGKLSDFPHAKLFAVSSLFIQALAFYLLTQSPNRHFITVNMLILGVSTYAFIAANNTWIIKQAGKKIEARQKSINISRAASNFGMGLSGVIIGLTPINNFRGLLYFSSMLLIFSAFYFQFFIPEKSMFEENNPIPCSKKSSQPNSKIILVTLCCVFFIGLVIAQLNSTYPLYIQHSFSSTTMHSVSILFILDTLIIVLLQTPLINFLKHYNQLFLMGLGALLMGFGMYTLNFSTTFILAIISCLIWTTGEMIFIPTAQLLCYEHSKENKKGRTMGMFYAISASSKVIGPSIGSYIYYYYSSNALWSLSMLTGSLCFSACLYFNKQGKHALVTNSNTSSNERTIVSETSL